MAITYEYYIWSDPENSDEDLQKRIEEALRNANLEYEYKNVEDY